MATPSDVLIQMMQGNIWVTKTLARNVPREIYNTMKQISAAGLHKYRVRAIDRDTGALIDMFNG